MEFDNSFINAILLVLGFFSIVLFFKIWDMTNDVKKIKDFLIEKQKEEKTIKK